MDKGNTALILTPFLEGMIESGAEVDLYYNYNLNIKPCRGCFNCWLKTPGVCAQKDDMQWLLPKMREADAIVYATPVYSYGMNGQMKDMVDRMMPLADPFMEVVDGRSRHIPGENEKPCKVVLVSNCGLWGMDNFEPLVAHIKKLCQDPPLEFAGALLRPHGEALRTMLDMGSPVGDIVEVARDAGRQLFREGKISQDKLDTISRELLPQEIYVDMANEQFRRVMEKRKVNS
ncbi:MAG: flavodoxin family protein [Chloroflexota bacterium]|nr:flavodoxin family protein [Chloroflexota bacterium]